MISHDLIFQGNSFGFGMESAGPFRASATGLRVSSAYNNSLLDWK